MTDQPRDPISRIMELWKQEPAEPFKEMRRRPKGYRKTSQYQDWHNKHKQWQDAVLQWLEDGLRVEKEPDRICMALHGKEIPHTEVVFLPDGTVQCDTYYVPREEPLPQGWAPVLELPGPSQDPEKFLEDNAKREAEWKKWELKTWLEELERRLGIPVHPRYQSDVRDRPYYRQLRQAVIKEGMVEWIRAVQERLDPEPIRRLRRLTGQQTRRNLRNHNMAVVSADVLRETARANPGALGWWMRQMEREDDLEIRQRWRYEKPEGPPPRLTAPPRHPGEIVAAAKREFQEAGGTQWKALISQPAKDSAALIARHEPQQIARFLNQMGKAALPSEPEPAPRPKPSPKPATAGNMSIPGLEPPANEDEKEPPSIPKKLQPPLEIKHLLIDKLKGRTGDHPRRNRNLPGIPYREAAAAPENQPEIDRALEKMVMLACREYAGQNFKERTDMGRQREANRINNVADYCRAEPQAAVRAATWGGLEKASRDWHNRAALRAIRNNLDKAREMIGPEFAKQWPAPLTIYESESGFTARLLRSPMDLMEETEIMNHCVGNSEYIRHCDEGDSRIFHIEPKGLPQEADQLLETRRKHGSTMELARGAQGWYIRQHQGCRNREVTEEEVRWGKEVMERWIQAVKSWEARQTGHSG